MESIRLREYRSANVSSPLRQPTLESQHGGVKNLRRTWERSARTLDDFEKTIQAIQQRTKIEETEDLSDLLRDYPRLKLRPGAKISQCLVWYKEFAPVTPRPLAACKMNFLAQQIRDDGILTTSKGFEPEPLQFVADSSFSLCIKQLATALQSDALGHLQLWYCV
jgi:hypothetical protein